MSNDVRSWGRRVLIAADALAGVVAALALVTFYVDPAAFGSYDKTSGVVGVAVRKSASLELTVLVATLLITVNVLFVLYGRRPREPLRWVASQGQGGVVRVSREALETGLKAAGEALDEVSRLRVSVEHGGLKRLVVHALFHAPEGASIGTASARLREALRERFRELVALGEGTRIDFDIEFVGFHGRPTRKAEPQPAEEAPPFTGPKYPIAEEDDENPAAR